MATTCSLTSSAPSNPHQTFGDAPSSSSQEDNSTDGSWQDTHPRSPRHGMHPASAGTTVGPRPPPLAPPGPSPGGRTSDVQDTGISRNATPRPDLGYFALGNRAADTDDTTNTEQRQAVLREQIEKELKIKSGTENMLEALLAKNLKQTKHQRIRVESELVSSNRKLEQLHRELEEEERQAEVSGPSGLGHLSTLFNGDPARNAFQNRGRTADEDESETESPTYVLAETLQALEVDGMQPDYYVEKANSLVELFKRHHTLKYDLEWSVFGLRIQMMLLSDSKEVIAAGYRLTRYAIVDRNSIRIVRSLHTDELVTLSLVKESKASMEREQALKFVRSFLDVKDGVREISRGVVRTLVSIADHRDDRLRNICIVTLAEIFVRGPGLVFYAGGVGTLNDALGDGTFSASESLASSFVHVLDSPRSRKYLRPGHELDAVFWCFTEGIPENERKAKLQPAARAISAMLKTWPGLLALSQNKFQPLRSLFQSLQYPERSLRDLIVELIYDALRIKIPSWSSSYLAGRRLTTYSRVRNLRSEKEEKELQAIAEQKNSDLDLSSHYAAILLATLVEAGVVQALARLVEDEPEVLLRRKATYLLTEVLKRAHYYLPQSVCAELQVLPQLIPPNVRECSDRDHIATSTIYHMDSINRTMMKAETTPTTPQQKDSGDAEPGASLHGTSLNASNDAAAPAASATGGTGGGNAEQPKLIAAMDEAQFRTAIMDTHVLSSSNYNKWDWDLIYEIIDGPLTNPKRLDEAIKGSKFLKRLVAFYRPFKRRFSYARNTKANQRYVRAGCALFRTLVQCPEGIKQLAESKLLRQIAECLAQVDRMSGLTAEAPIFSRQHMADTLSWGYFALLGALTGEPRGLQMIERWHMINMFYHIVELKGRNDLVAHLLGNMDYTRESHLRIILSKALTTGSKEIRILATNLLKKYAVQRPDPNQPIDWVTKLLVTQLYDPDLAVCQVAVNVLEEACIQRDCLEYVVRCRPSLDHLGEIGAPLLLRFLSTSIGYQYLDGFDYITQEMDDWFLGRNDAYVGLVEATLSRAFVDHPLRPPSEETVDLQSSCPLPPHFYRELVRTEEGCKLLDQSGHFEEFVSSIRNFNLDEEDPEILLKVKGCLWAVGNLGSMELSAPFLEHSDIVESIVRIAENAAVYSMRGTAVFILGLISRTQHGLELLFQEGWVTALDHSGYSKGFCMPFYLGKLSTVRPIPFVPKPETREMENGPSGADSDPVNQKILRLMTDLGNAVLSKRSASDLHAIKVKRPEYFKQTQLFGNAMIVLESHNFRLPVRRFVLDLFDKNVLRRVVLGEEESGSDLESESDSESMASE